MAKVFNVDQLAEETRQIVLKGKTHEIKPMSVDDFLATMAEADKLDKDASPQAQIDAVVKTIARAIPTLSEDDVKALPFDQMNAIAQFIRGDIPEELKKAVEEKN
jgi:uncharacterized protein (DUF2267 family)